MNSLGFDRIGDVVLALGSPRFGNEYYKLFHDALGIKACTVFAFRPEGSPIPLVVETDSRDRRQQAWDLAWEYSKGAFKHDPIIRGNMNRTSSETTPVVYSLSANQVKDAGYRRHFYDEPALRQKVGVLGKVDGTVYYSNFYRGPDRSGCNEADELRLMRELGGLAVKVLRRHDLASGTPAVASMKDGAPSDWHRSALAHLRTTFLSAPHGLSPREAEVVAHVVLGYSTLAIGLNLGVSVNTVATHRKRAYSKLDVCSQNELFERYFTTVNRLLAEQHQ